MTEPGVNFNDNYNCWIIDGHEEALSAMKSSALRIPKLDLPVGLLSGANAYELLPVWEQVNDVLLYSDEEKHRRCRRFLRQPFTRSAVEGRRGEVRSLVNRIIDGRLPVRNAEVIADIARPLLSQLMAEVIGIPMPLRTDFDSWTRAVGDAGKMGTSAWSADVAREAVRSLNSINLLVDELVGSQANVPSGSIISFAQRDAGSVDSLTLRELAANVRSIFRAGVDTTQYLIASVAYLIFSQDSVLRELRAEPENVTRVVQEVLRFACPAVEIPVRRANQDILIGGEMIKRGELVRIVTLKAERDPRRYPRPNIFDYRRAAPVRPLTYGVGPHTCLGNLFATTIAEEVGRALVDPKYGARLHSPTPKFRRRTTAPVIWGPEWVNIEFAGH